MNKEVATALAFAALVAVFAVRTLVGGAASASPRLAPSEASGPAWFSQVQRLPRPLFLKDLPPLSSRDVFVDFDDWQVPDLGPLPLPPERRLRQPAPPPVFPGGAAFPAPIPAEGRP